MPLWLELKVIRVEIFPMHVQDPVFVIHFKVVFFYSPVDDFRWRDNSSIFCYPLASWICSMLILSIVSLSMTHGIHQWYCLCLHRIRVEWVGFFPIYPTVCFLAILRSRGDNARRKNLISTCWFCFWLPSSVIPFEVFIKIQNSDVFSSSSSFTSGILVNFSFIVLENVPPRFCPFILFSNDLIIKEIVESVS